MKNMLKFLRLFAAANQNDTKKIEELFAPNIRGKEFQKEVDDFLEFYNKTAKDGTWDKDDILLGVREVRIDIFIVSCILR